MFAITNVSDSGTTAQTANAGTSDSTGAVRNRNSFALDGTTISLRSILMTSANGCSSPSSRRGSGRCARASTRGSCAPST